MAARAGSSAVEVSALMRTLEMIHASDQALIHAHDEQQLLETVCRIAVDAGGYKLAWVGYAQDDAEKSVRPMAHSGDAGDYVAAVRASWADNERGRGPTGVAIREGRTVVARDFMVEDRMAPWREAAARFGFRSSISVPLRADTRVLGALMIYSTRADAFDEAERGLLEELAGDLAFGVSALRARAAQQRAEAELRSKEARYRRLVDALNDGLVEVDGEYRITLANEPFARMLGLEAAALLGRHTYEFFDTPNYDEVVRRTRGPGAPISERYEIEWRRADGTLVPTLISARRAFDDEHRYQGSLSVVTDLTELKRAQAASERLAQIVETAQDGIVGEDLDGRVVAWNKGAEVMYGYTAQEMIGRSVDLLAPPGHKGEGADLVRKIIDGERVEHFETERVAKDGRRLIVSITLSPIRDPSGRVVGVSRVFRDVTAQRRAETELQQQHLHLEELVAARTAELELANKDLEAFAYSVSHDLRAPLRAVDGFSQILVEDYGGKLDAEGLHVVTVIREGAQKMSRMIDDILAFSRAGRLELKAEPVDMKALAEAALADLQSALAGRTVKIEIGDLPAAVGDAAMLQRVWQNLLDNAIKYTGPKPDARIEVGAEAGAGETIYFVRDNGVGFDMQYVDKLFGVFQRLHGAEFPGTGIGLAIIKRIVGRHGGRIWAEGKVGEGATFRFALPNAARADG